MKVLVDHFVATAWSAGIFRIGTRWLREDHDAHRLASEIAAQYDGHRTPDQILVSAAAQANEILWDRIEGKNAA